MIDPITMAVDPTTAVKTEYSVLVDNKVHLTAGVPGGLVAYPRAYLNQFREFKSHRVHILVGSFSRIKND